MSACRLCGAEVEERRFLERWECSGCGLVYSKEPPELVTFHGLVSSVEKRVKILDHDVGLLIRDLEKT